MEHEFPREADKFPQLLVKEADWGGEAFFRGLVHGDLYGGNLLLHRSDPLFKPFWIIDLANCRESFIGYDQAYLEIGTA